MKKLKTYICLAAVLLLTTQALMAQTTATEPTSGVGESTNSRFTNDVDLFFSVNDWAALEFSKWFGYLRMQNLNTAEGGLALQLTKAYLGFYYHGKFNTQSNNVGTYTWDYATGNPFVNNAPDFGGFWGTAGAAGGANQIIDVPPLGSGNDLADLNNNGIKRANYYGVLLGLGNHGFKLSVLDNRTKIDLPYVRTATAIPAADTPSGQELPAGTYGTFTKRTGDVIPKFQWGAATDMTFGKYSTRPSASLAFAVIYNDYEFIDLQAPDGETFDNIQNYNNNRLIPTLGVDTGSINFWSGDWGALSLGASEEFSLKVYGEGTGKTRQYAETAGAPAPAPQDTVEWENKLTPYAIFEYQANEYFALGAKLSVPIWLGWDGGTGTFVGVGARGTGVGYDFINAQDISATLPTGDFPLLETGFQLKASAFEKLTERYGVLDQLILNWGIKVNLPGYYYSGTYDYNSKNPDDSITQITKSGGHYWINNSQNGGWLNEVCGGFSFYITPNAVLDASFGKNQTEPFFARVLLSVKHNPFGGTTPAPSEE